MDLGKFLFNILYGGKIDNDGIKLEEEVNQIAEIIAQHPLGGHCHGRERVLISSGHYGAFGRL